MTDGDTTGLTRDAGWEIGVSRTFPATVEQVRAFLRSDEGLAIWLGPGARVPAETGESFTADDGSHGELRSDPDGDRIRIRHRRSADEAPTTVQVSVRPAAGGATIRLHEEQLTGPEERAAQRKHWRGVLDRLGAALG